MNKLKGILTAAVLFAGMTTAFAKAKTDNIKVSGNCGSCEKHIETAAKKAGVTTAKWNKTTKMLVVTYDDAKTSNDAIQKTIASVGYDTEKYAGDMKAYKGLEECCQYDGKKK